MKRMLLLFALLPGFTVVFAQSIDAGKQHYYYERYKSAENFFHTYLSTHPQEAEAWFWLTKSYFVQDNSSKAADSLAFAPASVHEEPYYMIARGMVALQSNKMDSAQLYFNNAIDETKGKNAEILGAVAGAHIVSPNGNTNYALELLQKALKRDKHNASLYVLVGDAYRKMHNGTEAFKEYRKAISEDKQLAAAYYKLGDIFVSQKNQDVYLDYFTQALNADKIYAPALAAMYTHYLYRDPAKAMGYFKEYAALSDKTLQHDYSYTDLLYLNNNYGDAITAAKQLTNSLGAEVQPRIYKLLAYCYAGLKDTGSATASMQQYFREEEDSNFVLKDFETMAGLYIAAGDSSGLDSAMIYYQYAIDKTTDSSILYNYYDKLAGLAKTKKDYEAEAKWLGKYYTGNEKATNVHLFNWGLAGFRAKDYQQADSVFGLYVAKYPEQGFGYYWQARSNAALDEEMKEGLAVPHYEKLIGIVTKDSVTAAANKKWLIEAYAYLAAYETNTEKDYAEAIDYFDRLLEVDPENADAKKYIAILEDNLESKGVQQEQEEVEQAK